MSDCLSVGLSKKCQVNVVFFYFFLKPPPPQKIAITLTASGGGGLRTLYFNYTPAPLPINYM